VNFLAEKLWGIDRARVVEDGEILPLFTIPYNTLQSFTIPYSPLQQNLGG